jgi:hypothetical protein
MPRERMRAQLASFTAGVLGGCGRAPNGQHRLVRRGSGAVHRWRWRYRPRG